MAHINHSRQIRLCPTLTLEQLFPQNELSENFAVLCGIPQQRTEIALYSMQRYVGKVGIIFIHDDPAMSNELSRLTRRNPQTNLYYANRNLFNARNYDPLYGLNERAITEIILPAQKNGFNSLDISSARARLGDYLSIMKSSVPELLPHTFWNPQYTLLSLQASCHKAVPNH